MSLFIFYLIISPFISTLHIILIKLDVPLGSILHLLFISSLYMCFPLNPEHNYNVYLTLFCINHSICTISTILSD